MKLKYGSMYYCYCIMLVSGTKISTIDGISFSILGVILILGGMYGVFKIISSLEQKLKKYEDENIEAQEILHSSDN